MAVRQPTRARLPGKSPLGSYIYVLSFSGGHATRLGIIKVGFTVNPQARIRTYRTSLFPFGISVRKRWISEPHGQAEDNESKLLDFCRRQAAPVNGREYFAGIDFDEVVSFAGTLTCAPLRPPGSEHAPYDASLMKYVQVADDIQARIKAGQLQPGARLPGERELADQYQIAYGTARRVIQELRDRGLVQTVPSKGTFIVEPPAEG